MIVLDKRYLKRVLNVVFVIDDDDIQVSPYQEPACGRTWTRR